MIDPEFKWLCLFVVDEDGGNLFMDKTFVLFGFPEHYEQELTEIIQEVKGKHTHVQQVDR